MRRSVIACSVALVAAPATAVSADAPRALLRSFVCQHALDPPARAVSITAVMRPLAGTRRMRLRFQLFSKKPRGPFTQVRGGDLGKWVSPRDPGLGRQPGDVWIVQKPVVDLVAPAVYRFRVSFRWSGKDGVLGRAMRLSRSCHQPELRPDLIVRSIAVQQVTGHPTEDRFTAVIRNGGATGAGPFQVQLVDGPTRATRTIAWLGPHSKRTVSFVGPACVSAHPPTITADPSGNVDDYNRANNSLTATCPAGASGGSAAHVNGAPAGG